MKNGLELYKRIGRKNTFAHRWNKLTIDEKCGLTFDEFKEIEYLKDKYNGKVKRLCNTH